MSCNIFRCQKNHNRQLAKKMKRNRQVYEVATCEENHLLEHLPDELLRIVSSYLDIRNKLRLYMTCRDFYRLREHDERVKSFDRFVSIMRDDTSVLNRIRDFIPRMTIPKVVVSKEHDIARIYENDYTDWYTMGNKFMIFNTGRVSRDINRDDLAIVHKTILIDRETNKYYMLWDFSKSNYYPIHIKRMGITCEVFKKDIWPMLCHSETTKPLSLHASNFWIQGSEFSSVHPLSGGCEDLRTCFEFLLTQKDFDESMFNSLKYYIEETK